MTQKNRPGLSKFLYITSFIAAALFGISAVRGGSFFNLLLGCVWAFIGCREYKSYKAQKTEADKAEQEAERARRAYLLYGKDEPAEKE